MGRVDTDRTPRKQELRWSQEKSWLFLFNSSSSCPRQTQLGLVYSPAQFSREWLSHVLLSHGEKALPTPSIPE